MESITQCDKNEEGFYIDSITGDYIPEDMLVSVQSGTVMHCFSIDTLYKSYVEGGYKPPVNPFTRKPLADNIVEKIIEYEKKNHIMVGVKIGNTIFPLWFPYYKSVGALIVKLLQFMESRNNNNMVEALKYDFRARRLDSIYHNDLEKSCQKIYGSTVIFTALKFDDPGFEHLSTENLYKYLEDKQDELVANRHIFMILNHRFNTNVELVIYYQSENITFKADVENFEHTFREILFFAYDRLIEAGHELKRLLCQVPRVRSIRSLGDYTLIKDLEEIPIPILRKVNVRLSRGYEFHELRNWLLLAKSVPAWENDASDLLEAMSQYDMDDFGTMRRYIDALVNNS